MFGGRVPDRGSDCLAWVASVARTLADGPTLALRLAKENLNDALSLEFSQLLDREAERFIITARTADAREATAAFLEKRAPRFGAE